MSTLHLQPGPADDQLIATLLFGDGATAAVVESSDQVPGRGLRLVREASALAADSEDQMSWLAGNEGFTLRLSPRIGAALAGELLPLARRLIVDSRPPAALRWAVHPGGPRILSMVESRFSLAATALASSRRELAQGGNRSSATILAILARELEADWRGEVALIAFGPGLTADAMLIERCA